MASGWLQKHLDNIAQVESAGTSALIGRSADPFAVEVSKQNGIDISCHKSRQLDSSMLRAADIVFVMEEMHRRLILEQSPWARGKVWRFGHHSDLDVPDPFRHDKIVFQGVFEMIVTLGQAWVSIVRGK